MKINITLKRIAIAAVAQWVRALAPQAEGCISDRNPAATDISHKSRYM